MSPDSVARLARLDTCAVADALDRMKLKGVVPGLTALSTTRRIAGEVVTVQLGPDDGRPSKRHLCTAAVEASGPGKVILVAHGRRTDVAGWGGILSLAASLRQAEGVVIDGACRDLDESREFGLPVYGRAWTPTTARGRITETDWACPVTIAGVAAAPGDLLIADASGVVIIPKDHAEEVLAIAERIAAKEKLMMADLRAGKTVSDVMGADYESMLSRGDFA